MNNDIPKMSISDVRKVLETSKKLEVGEKNPELKLRKPKIFNIKKVKVEPEPELKEIVLTIPENENIFKLLKENLKLFFYWRESFLLLDEKCYLSFDLYIESSNWNLYFKDKGIEKNLFQIIFWDFISAIMKKISKFNNFVELQSMKEYKQYRFLWSSAIDYNNCYKLNRFWKITKLKEYYSLWIKSLNADENKIGYRLIWSILERVFNSCLNIKPDKTIFLSRIKDILGKWNLFYDVNLFSNNEKKFIEDEINNFLEPMKMKFPYYCEWKERDELLKKCKNDIGF